MTNDESVDRAQLAAVPRDVQHLKLRPWRVELAEANDFVEKIHRHHNPEPGHRFSLGVGDDQLRGVAICGRPKAGHSLDQRLTLEVLRVATDGSRNACSYLYAAAARCGESMGFPVVITYTLERESGASLRACGWWPELLEEREGNWNAEKRGGQATLFAMPPKKGQDLGAKIRWIWLTGVAWPEPRGVVTP